MQGTSLISINIHNSVRNGIAITPILQVKGAVGYTASEKWNQDQNLSSKPLFVPKGQAVYFLEGGWI